MSFDLPQPNINDPAATLAASAASQRANILRARAAILAEPLVEDRSHDKLEVLLLRLDNQAYAIALSFVVEVLTVKEITSLPGTPEFTLGILNVRGQIFSVIDLLRFLGLRDSRAGGDKVVIVSSGAMELGILVDEVVGVGSVALAEIQSGSGAFASEQSAYFQGVTSARLAILNMAALLEDGKLIVNDEVDA